MFKLRSTIAKRTRHVHIFEIFNSSFTCERVISDANFIRKFSKLDKLSLLQIMSLWKNRKSQILITNYPSREWKDCRNTKRKKIPAIIKISEVQARLSFSRCVSQIFIFNRRMTEKLKKIGKRKMKKEN